jgi:hypothetical protein
MKISGLKRIEMKNIDGSNDVRYSAIIDGSSGVVYTTDGIIKKHLSIEQWKQYIKDNLK